MQLKDWLEKFLSESDISFQGNGVTYTSSFSSGVTPSSQCTTWLSFVSQLTGSYTTLTISGSNDPTGITLTNSAMVAAIASALRNGNSYGPTSSNGYSWAVGPCAVSGSYNELTATGTVCGCNTGYTARPCIGNTNWGGVNSATCGGPTQSITVTFQWNSILTDNTHTLNSFIFMWNIFWWLRFTVSFIRI